MRAPTSSHTYHILSTCNQNSSVSAEMSISDSLLTGLLSKHVQVPGTTVAVVEQYKVTSHVAGLARVSTADNFTSSHFIQCASLSKTVAAAFAHEYFSSKAISMTTPVNQLLRSVKSEWLIESTNPAFHGDDVTLSMLVNHTALGMHYVYGIPLSRRIPTPLELINGSAKEDGYEYLKLERPAGSVFSYSGGGFVVMQYLLELMEGRPIEEITRHFLDGCGLRDFVFTQRSAAPGTKFAFGHKPAAGGLAEVEPLAFPPLAAGALCTPTALAEFLCCLARAYHDPAGCGSLSHSTALHMLSPQYTLDLGAIDFMGAEVDVSMRRLLFTAELSLFALLNRSEAVYL
jgi:CubicO group peptidase (beta-lactamase class C family)